MSKLPIRDHCGHHLLDFQLNPNVHLSPTPIAQFCDASFPELREVLWVKYFSNLTKRSLFDRLSPNSDENEISVYIIATCSNIEVMRIKEVITKEKMS